MQKKPRQHRDITHLRLVWPILQSRSTVATWQLVLQLVLGCSHQPHSELGPVCSGVASPENQALELGMLCDEGQVEVLAACRAGRSAPAQDSPVLSHL